MIFLLGFGRGFGFPLHAYTGDGVHVDEHGAVEGPRTLFAGADAHLTLGKGGVTFYTLFAANGAGFGSGWHSL